MTILLMAAVGGALAFGRWFWPSYIAAGLALVLAVAVR